MQNINQKFSIVLGFLETFIYLSKCLLPLVTVNEFLEDDVLLINAAIGDGSEDLHDSVIAAMQVQTV